MRLGLFNLMSFKDNAGGLQGVIRDTREMIQVAEAIGFETAWFAEHHFTNYSISVSPLMMAAHMAGHTSRIRLGTAVIVLPLYQPMRVAQEIALVDRLTEGRLVLGIGSGYQAWEFDRYGLDVEARTEQLLAHWQFVSDALTAGKTLSASRSGAPLYTDFLLDTLQQPLPPLYVTSTNPAVLKAFEPWQATPFMTAGYRGTHKLRQMVRDARAGWQEAGLNGDMPVAVQQYIHVTDSRSEAREAAGRAMFVARMIAALQGNTKVTGEAFIEAPPFAGEPSLDQVCDNLMFGDAETVAERIISEVREIRPSHYNCFFQFGDMPLAKARRSLELFGERVVPLLEAHLGKITVDLNPAMAR
ncbi:LLM class flavin-dependent oxidoreductase [Pantoea sp. BAV 3049]|uniref:LLM class flavin-dependent oxidoreductase n=1 Tax=Pantoea sp. BAV 3049 TaxID=2654188 RepID=UPI00131D9B0F|nr:LLM class flavin-dependent oxidoreductase [Pantoea sp. BAV 3049]